MNRTSLPDTLAANYHRSVRTENSAKAHAYARLGLQIPAYRNEASLWMGLVFFEARQFSLAFMYLAQGIEQQPAQLHALLVRCLQQQGLLSQALHLLEAALMRHPTDPTLRQLQVPLLLTMHEAGVLALTTLRTRLHQLLPDISDAQELRLTLEALHSQTQAPLIGTVWHDPVQQHIGGWIVDLEQPTRPLEIDVEFLHQGRPVRLRLAARSPNPLLQAAYGISHGGFRAQLPHAMDALHVRFADGPPLIGSPLAAVPVFTPPAASTASAHKGKAARKQTVDVLVPVFKGRQATLECVDSVNQYAAHNRTPHRLIVLDDASPDAELVAALRQRERHGKLQYLRQPANLGFIRNMNRGMALHPERDVVWLNADTRVHGDWLDRLHHAAYSVDDIASVTPFSNNGELMSYPRPRYAAPMPEVEAHAALDVAACRLGLSPVPLETGCGFCLYIKRRALEDVGYLDEIELKRGYGEETDWCLRAQSKGWRHVGAVNVFVAHAGGHSFGPEKALRVFQNNAILRRRYPKAEQNFQRYVAADPLAPARQQLSTALERAPDGPGCNWLKAVLDTVEPEKTATQAQDVPATNSASPPSMTAPIWRIADRIDQHSTATTPQRWLRLARHFARQARQHPATPILLLDQDSPWEIELLHTGQVLKMPRLAGLSRQDMLAACGNPPAVSLAGPTLPDWLATLLASPYAPLETACPATTP